MKRFLAAAGVAAIPAIIAAGASLLQPRDTPAQAAARASVVSGCKHPTFYKIIHLGKSCDQ